MTRIVHVPYVVEQDEDGVWCACAQLRPVVGAVGDGPSAEAAAADLRGALETLLAEVGPPDELTLAGHLMPGAGRRSRRGGSRAVR